MKTLGQVSPCQWVQDNDFTFGYLSSKTLDLSYLNTLTLINTSNIHDELIKKKFLVNTISPKCIEIYSPSCYFENENLPHIENYKYPLHYIFYHCSLSSYKLPDINDSSCKLSRVRCSQSLEDWVNIQSSYHPSIKLALKCYINYFGLLLESTSAIELLLLYVNDIAVNASLIFMNDHTCYGGWSVTLPYYQRHGYGLVSTAYQIKRARSYGMKVYFGLAGPASFSICESLNLDAVSSFIRYKKDVPHI